MKGIIYILLFMGMTFPMYGQDLSNGLVAHYPLDGDATDISGNGYNGVEENLNLGTDRFVVADKAVGFVVNPLSSSSITISSNADFESTSFSFNIWATTNAVPNTGNPVIKSSSYLINKIPASGTNVRYQFGVYNTDLTLFSVTTTQVPTVPIMLTLTYDDTTKSIKAYYDGQLVGEETLTGTFNVNANDIIIGNNFGGVLDESRFYNRVLTQEEIDLP